MAPLRLSHAAAGRDPLTNGFEILAGLEEGNYVARGAWAGTVSES